MKIIVGLGNPGEKYVNTRHNLGFLVLDRFLKDSSSVERSVWKIEEKFKSDVAQLRLNNTAGEEEPVLLVKPRTFMNNSGMAVQLVASFYKLSPENLWIIHDDLDLPLGSMKIRFGGAAAGHRGVENIINVLGTDKFWRFRLGIGAMRHSSRGDDGKGHAISKAKINDVEDYVLGTFEGKDHTEAKKMVKHASEALGVALKKGLEAAQNRFNTK